MSKILYLIVSFFGKVSKSSIEIVLYLVLSKEIYAAFIVFFHQAQIATSGILFGFSSAGYKLYRKNPAVRLLRLAVALVVLNFAVAFVVASLLGTGYVDRSVLVAALGLAVITACALYLRSHENILMSVVVLEIMPYVLLTLLAVVWSRHINLPVQYVVIVVSLVSAIFAAAFCLGISEQHDESADTVEARPSLKDIYRTCLPFFVVSLINVLLSKADTSILQNFVTGAVLADYTISSRFAALLMAISYILQHLYIPKVINAPDTATIIKYISVYMRETLLLSGLGLAFIVGLTYFGLLKKIGFDVKLDIVLVCGILTLLIVPQTIFSYLLILNRKTLSVITITLTGFGIVVGSLFAFADRLNGILIATIFLGGVLFVKTSETIMFYWLLSKNRL